jgi:hypothetical protein
VGRFAALAGNLALFVLIHAGEASWIVGHGILPFSTTPLVDCCQPEDVMRPGPTERASDNVTRFDDPLRKRTTRKKSFFSTNDVRPEIPARGLMSARETAKRQSIALELQRLVVAAQTACELHQPF